MRTFATTHWSMVLSARDANSPESHQAMAALCEAYWYPLYAYARRVGRSPEHAEDLTQAFFARLLEKHYLDAVDRARGRFRSFLLTAFKRFMADDYDKSKALKKGGGRRQFSLDIDDAENRYRLEPSHNLGPEKLFERRWAMSLLSSVTARLAKNYADAEKHELFQVIQGFIVPDSQPTDYGSAAQSLEMKEGAVRMAVHRLRRRYLQILREEIANTVSSEDEIEDEMRQLRKILSE